MHVKIAYLIQWLDEPLQALTNEPSKENIKNVLNKIKKLSSTDINDIQNFLILPADYHLRKGNLNDTQKYSLINYLNVILEKSQTTNIQKFHKLLTLVFFQIYVSKNPSQIQNISEELKISVLSFTINLCKSCTFDKIELYKEENVAKIGQAIFITTKILQNEKSFTIKLKGIECLGQLIHCDCNSEDFTQNFRNQLSKALKMLLPGLSSTFHSILKQADIQQHQLTKESLLTWCRLIVLTLKDERDSFKLKSHYSFKLHQKEEGEEEIATPPPQIGSNTLEIVQNIVHFQETSSWLFNTSQHLRLLLKDLTPLSTHSHPEVREALANAASLLVLQCPRNLGPSLLPLIEALLVLQEDDILSVSTSALDALDLIRNHLDKNDADSLLNLLEDGFLQHISALPRLVIAIDSGEQIRPFRLLSGYATLLGSSHLLRILTPSQHCQRLLASLVAALRLDTSNVALIEVAQNKDLDSTHDHHSRLWLRFLHLTSPQVDRLIDSIIDKLLNSSELIEFLLDEILEYYQREPLLRAEISILINVICRSELTNETQLETILELYLDPGHWQQPTLSESSLEGTRIRALEACLQAEGLGEIGASLGESISAPQHIRILIAILERAGSSISLLSLAGRQALERLALRGYGISVAELLSRSAQHLACVLGSRVRREKDHTRISATLEILAITLRFAGENALGYYRQAVNDIIDRSSSANASTPAHGYLRVLKSLTERLSEWFLINKSEETAEDQEQIKQKSAVELLKEYHRNKMRSKLYEDSDFCGENVEMNDNQLSSPVSEENQDSKDSKLSNPLTDLLEAIVRRCMHYLPSREKTNRLLALEVLNQALPLLHKHSASDVFLPAVHSVWPTLVSVFKHRSDIVLVRVGWSLLITLAKTSGEFVTHRVLKELWPDVLKFLKDTEPLYDETSQLFKLRLELLNEIPFLMKKLKMNEQQLNHILTACQPFLEKKHAKSMQVTCRNMFKNLAEINRDLVWLHVISLNKDLELLPPSQSQILLPLKVKIKNRGNLYGNNLDKILKDIS